MTDYTKYNPEDFLSDESFGNYLLQKDQQSVLFWQKWIRENPDCSSKLKEAEILFFLLRSENKKSGERVEVKENFGKLVSMIQTKDGEKQEDQFSPAVKSISKTKIEFKKILLWVASSAAILLIVFSVWMYSKSSNGAAPEFRPYAQSQDHSDIISLEDGTVIHLTNHSSIAISKDYNKQKREISLTGSAFFKVAKDPSRPFIVTSGEIKTTALGTSFYIYSLHTKNTTVSLLEGKVRVEGYKNSVELLPGEKAFLNGNSTIFKNEFNEKQLRNLVLGNISFDQAPFEEIKTVLEEYYNMNVEAKGKIPALNFTGKFDTNNIQSILEALEFTYDIHYKINGQTLTLSFN